VIDKVWEAGVPHLIFTGGEPTLRPDLPDLISRAEENGQVTGLLTGGQRLADPEYLEQLLQTGLDHLMYVLSPKVEGAWDALEQVLNQDLFTTVHLTIKADTLDHLDGHIARLAALGANALSLSVSDPADPNLTAALEEARTAAAEARLNLKWDLPVPYSRHHPVALELEDDEPPAQENRGLLYVEPDGDVLPAQGINRVLGNLLRDRWEDIWESAG
jgi:MoaA/NifB/PqqE/SkfB family radical SAM enzyme